MLPESSMGYREQKEISQTRNKVALLIKRLTFCIKKSLKFATSSCTTTDFTHEKEKQ